MTLSLCWRLPVCLFCNQTKVVITFVSSNASLKYASFCCYCAVVLILFSFRLLPPSATPPAWPFLHLELLFFIYAFFLFVGLKASWVYCELLFHKRCTFCCRVYLVSELALLEQVLRPKVPGWLCSLSQFVSLIINAASMSYPLLYTRWHTFSDSPSVYLQNTLPGTELTVNIATLTDRIFLSQMCIFLLSLFWQLLYDYFRELSYLAFCSTALFVICKWWIFLIDESS